MQMFVCECLCSLSTRQRCQFFAKNQFFFLLRPSYTCPSWAAVVAGHARTRFVDRFFVLLLAFANFTLNLNLAPSAPERAHPVPTWGSDDAKPVFAWQNLASTRQGLAGMVVVSSSRTQNKKRSSCEFYCFPNVVCGAKVLVRVGVLMVLEEPVLVVRSKGGPVEELLAMFASVLTSIWTIDAQKCFLLDRLWKVM